MTSLASAQSARLAAGVKRKAKSKGSTTEVWRPSTDLQNAARGGPPPAKRAKTQDSSGLLDSWLGASASIPELIVPSSEITDRGSTFLAHAATVESKTAAMTFRDHIRRTHAAANDEALHEMVAWRCVGLMEGRSGANPGDFAVTSGGDEDGEKWASTHMVKVLEETNSVDVAIVCSRWYGGTMLGPIRFQHIRDVCKEAIENLKVAAELDTLKEQILVKDAAIAELAPQSPGKVPSYEDLDLAKARRLLLAREKRLEFLEAHAASKQVDEEPAGGGFLLDEESAEA